MGSASKSVIKTHNLIEKWRVFNLIVCENYVGPHYLFVIDSVTLTVPEL